MRLFLLSILFAFYTLEGNSQTFLGITTYGNDRVSEQLYGLVTDKEDNTIFCGAFIDQITFGDTTLISKGTRNMFLVKLTVAGKVVWARRAGGEGVVT